MLKRYFIPLIVALILALVVVFWLSLATRKAQDIREAVPVESFTLSNGLNVVVMPSTRIPVVSHLLVVKAGGADDPQGKSGLAHYLEHLMFSGTNNFPEGDYDRAISRVGGAQNAYTTRDYTLYYATVPKEHLPMVMTMEADRLANLVIEPAIAARELKVITEERGMRVESSPAALWSEQLDAMTLLNHPYGKPLIGWAEDMATFTPADARGFFTRYYRASNMVLVVAGDVSVRDVRRYAQRYYGGLPAGEVTRNAWAKEPPMRMMRRGEMHDPRVNEPRLLMQFVAPSVHEGGREQAMALSVMAQYLGGGDASALYDALVRQQKLATSVSVNYDAEVLGPAMLRIYAMPAVGVSLPQLEEALRRELAVQMASPLDKDALARAKTLMKAQVIFAQDGLQPLANSMASLYAIGLDEQYFYQWADVIEAVNAPAVQAAARAVIDPKRAVVGYLLPDVTEASHAP